MEKLLLNFIRAEGSGMGSKGMSNVVVRSMISNMAEPMKMTLSGMLEDGAQSVVLAKEFFKKI